MAINRDNLRFLLSHFDPPVFPRRISTQLSKNKQFAVNSLEEMLRKFEESDFIDCKVNAYNYIGQTVADAAADDDDAAKPSNGNGNGKHSPLSPYSATTTTTGLADAVKLIQQRAMAEPIPSVIFIDLDQKKYLHKTIRKIKDTFVDEKLEPTVIDSGHGYHIILPVETDPAKYYYCPRPDWDKNKLIPGRSNWLASVIAQDYKYGIPANLSPANMFIQFAEDYLTSNKADLGHYPSVRSCMVRVPGTYNSECIEEGVDSEVKIVNRWNGQQTKAHILFLINKFYYHVKETHEKRQKMMLKARKKRLRLESSRRFAGSRFEIDAKTDALSGAIKHSSGTTMMLNPKLTDALIMEIAHKTHWYIELLFQIAVDDFRKRAVTLLFAPYMITIKQMDSEITEQLIFNWLERCSEARLLDFDQIELTQQAINYARDRVYLPLGEVKLRDQAPDLFAKLERMSNRGGVRVEGGN